MKEETDRAIALFGDKDAGGIVLLRTYREYYEGYEQEGRWQTGYRDLVGRLENNYPLGQAILGESKQKDFIKIFGKILRVRNILTCFDEFENDRLLSGRDLQDYQSIYLDLYQEIRGKQAVDKEDINDDIIFELELVRQIEVNIDYILILVARYKDSNCQDKDILTAIDKAINSSLELRSKKDLIENFIAQVNVDTNVDEDWKTYLEESREREIKTLISEENLKEEETRRFVDNAFRDGIMRTTGTDIDRLMPPVSRFQSNRRAIKKQTIIDKLLAFFERYFGLG